MKDQKFKQLAEKRVTNALKYIKLIGNLSNKNSYDYSDQQVNRIFMTLKNELDSAGNKFKSGNKQDTKVFTL